MYLCLLSLQLIFQSYHLACMTVPFGRGALNESFDGGIQHYVFASSDTQGQYLCIVAVTCVELSGCTPVEALTSAE